MCSGSSSALSTGPLLSTCAVVIVPDPISVPSFVSVNSY